jgi:hypothetical protein
VVGSICEGEAWSGARMGMLPEVVESAEQPSGLGIVRCVAVESFFSVDFALDFGVGLKSGNGVISSSSSSSSSLKVVLLWRDRVVMLGAEEGP